MQSLPPIKAVLFDLDGTLIDSVPIYLNIVATVLQTLGMPPVSRSQVVTGLKDSLFDWQAVFPEDQKQNQTLAAAAQKEVLKVAPKLFHNGLKLVPDADRVLQQLSDANFKIGLVTATPHKYLANKLRILKKSRWQQWFDAVIDADDVVAQKPAPDALIACSRQLRIAPANCVYVGDTYTDIQAGNAAGMPTMAVLTGFDNHATLKAEKPTAIIHSVRDLPTLLDRGPGE